MALIPRKRMSSDLLDPKPKKGSFNGVTSDGVFNATGEAIDNILDDGSASETVVVAVPSSQSSNYTVGYYYEVQGKVAKLRTKTDGDNVTQLTFDTASGVLAAINGSTGKIAVFKFAGTDYPLVDDMNAELLKGKDIVLIRTSYPSRYDVFYLTYRNSGSGHVRMKFTGTNEILEVEDDVWTVTEQANGVKYVSIGDSYSDVQAIIDRGQFPVMKVTAGQGYLYYYPSFEYGQFVFKCVADSEIYGLRWNGTEWAAQDAVIYGMGSDTKSEVDIDQGVLAIDGGNTVTKVTLATVNAVTFSVDLSVPAFAIEIDNTGNSNDVNVTVVNGATALKYSSAAGNQVGAGKYVQLTCVGGCWTLAEFEAPTP